MLTEQAYYAAMALAFSPIAVLLSWWIVGFLADLIVGALRAMTPKR
jgi:hypothetical protein